MRLRQFIIPALAAAILAVSGCGSSDCADGQDVKDAFLGGETAQYVVQDTTKPRDDHYNPRLRCADGLSSTEVGAKGMQTDATSSYTLTEVMGMADYPYENKKYQTGVTITARPPAGSQIMSSIVRTVDSSDAELRLSIGSGGVYEATIKSAQYALDPTTPWEYPVSSVIFCIKSTT